MKPRRSAEGADTPGAAGDFGIQRDASPALPYGSLCGFSDRPISAALMWLLDSWLEPDRRDGCNVFYRVIEPRIFDVLKAVEQMLAPQQLSRRDRPAVSCSCPKCSAVTGS